MALLRSLLVLLASGCTASTPVPAPEPLRGVVVVPITPAPVPEVRNSDGSPRHFPPAPNDLPGVVATRDRSLSQVPSLALRN